MPRPSSVGLDGKLFLTFECDHPDRVVVLRYGQPRPRPVPGQVIIGTSSRGCATFDAKRGVWTVEDYNGVVNTGLNNMLDRWFGLSGPPAAIGFIGVGSNTTAVTAATAFLNGAGAGSAANTIIKAISPAATRSAQTVTGGATFANADFTAGVFVINKIGLLTTSTDAGTGLIDVIGGTGGADPYSRTFVVDFTNAGSFTLVPQIAMTAVAVKGSFPSPL